MQKKQTTCDNCGESACDDSQEALNALDFERFAVARVQGSGQWKSYGKLSDSFEADICRECRKKLGLDVFARHGVKPEQTPVEVVMDALNDWIGETVERQVEDVTNG